MLPPQSSKRTHANCHVSLDIQFTITQVTQQSNNPTSSSTLNETNVKKWWRQQYTSNRSVLSQPQTKTTLPVFIEMFLFLNCSVLSVMFVVYFAHLILRSYGWYLKCLHLVTTYCWPCIIYQYFYTIVCLCNWLADVVSQ